MRKKKGFEAVSFQRKVREELGKKYRRDRDSFLRELRERYGRTRKPEVAARSE